MSTSGTVTNEPKSDDGGGASTGFIVGVSVGSAALAAGCGGLLYGLHRSAQRRRGAAAAAAGVADSAADANGASPDDYATSNPLYRVSPSDRKPLTESVPELA